MYECMNMQYKYLRDDDKKRVITYICLKIYIYIYIITL